MKKILFIVLDGLGDEPIPDFGNKTPLEAAKTPNLDLLAEQGICGQLLVKARGAIPTSEEGHFSLFGYDPQKYKIRRGIITVTGTGMRAKRGDVALRGNFATVDSRMNIVDRRAGRIEDVKKLIVALEKIKINNIRFLIKSATQHRLGIIIRGKGLSPNISDGDPHYGKLGKRARKIKPLDSSKEAVYTAQVLNEFLRKSRQILSNHPQNKRRIERGLVPANYVLTRGASSLPKLPSFKKKYGLGACCIAGKFLYQQIGRILGMDILKAKGATGKQDTNLKGKIKTAQKALEKYDFVFLHIKATDSLAEDGNYRGKKKFIEEIDKELSPLLELKETLIAITCDHSTCSLLKRHCKLPCPILIWGGGGDNVSEFSEKSCGRGWLKKMKQIELMDRLLGFMLS